MRVCKKSLFTFAVGVAVLLFIAQTPAFAHPPQRIRITTAGYNISIVVTHVVPEGISDFSKHYLSKVEIYVNNNKVHEEEYMGPQRGSAVLVPFMYKDLKRGDTIKVKAYSSDYGDMTKEYLVEEDPARQAAAAEQAQAQAAGQSKNPQASQENPAQGSPLVEVQSGSSESQRQQGESAEAQAYWGNSGSSEDASGDQ